MTTPKALVLRSGGTNCEDETARALELGGAEADILHCDRVLEDPARLDPYQILVFAGGFSYGDDLAAGLELRTRLREKLGGHVAGGGLILGVCNGFQVLVESGIFEPDKAPEERSIALYANASNHYECRWVEIEAQDCRCPWLTAGERMPTPVAHAEGRFVVRDGAALEALRAGGQIALTYVGQGYPANPNGAVADIAGICDPTGQVLGLMPHPERNLDPWNHPAWTSLGKRSEGEGLAFYRRMVEVAASGQPVV
ncbi:MAG: phosphoribosylformylglycinamidine synthase subunit PurQ [Planctomycetota bacterium]|nr:phosphoribosylformylglycinamidine synthase subunit PurQ [Planctomycetota bacterium]